MRTLSALFAVIFLSLAATACAHRAEHGVGLQYAQAPDPGDRPLQLAIWYPSDAAAQPTQVALDQFDVAMNGAPRGRGLPLIVMSHGTGGSLFNSSDLAQNLAQAGFVVVAVTHTGDNYQDRAYSFSRRNWVERPRHITRVIDFMLHDWANRDVIDPDRIGLFGHSAGGATSLIAVGGAFDWSRVGAYCQGNPEDWGCRNERERRAGQGAVESDAAPVIARDERIRAAVVAAPALSVAFEPNGLAAVSAPVQVWVAGEDAIVPDAAVLQTLLPQVDYRLVPNAGHFSFLAPCSAAMMRTAPEICTDPPGFDRAVFQQDFAQKIVKFFQASLRGDNPTQRH